jgi:hypothetical protein
MTKNNSIKPIFLFLLACIFLFGLIGFSACTEKIQHLTQTNGTWVASDNSLRIHFFLNANSPDNRFSQGGIYYSPPLLVDVVVANLKTGSVQLIPYSLTTPNNGLEFNASYEYIDPQGTKWKNQPLNSEFPADFTITEISKNSLVLQIKDQLPVSYAKVDRPNSLGELTNYSSKYSPEEYLSMIVRGGLGWLPIYTGKITFERSLENKYTIYIKDVPLTTDSGVHSLKPGKDAELIMSPLRNVLSPISDKIEAIYYTERWTGK